MNPEMTADAALKVIIQVTSGVALNMADNNILRQALQVLSKTLEEHEAECEPCHADTQ